MFLCRTLETQVLRDLLRQMKGNQKTQQAEPGLESLRTPPSFCVTSDIHYCVPR